MRSSVILASLLFSHANPASAPMASETTCSAPVPVPPTVTTPNSTYYSDGLPPVRFRGNGRLTVEFAGQSRIDKVCGKAPCNMVTLGCTSLNAHPVMTLPNPCTYGAKDNYAALVCHELGHLNGWPSTHGD